MKVRVYHDGIHEAHGALEALLKKLCPRIATCDCIPSKNVGGKLLHGKGSRLLKKAILCTQQAHSEGFDAVVLLVDEDGDKSRLRDLEAACHQEIPNTLPRRAYAVAIHSFDAWILADEKAMSFALGRPVHRTPEPEKISNPKAKAREICGTDMALRDFYARVAEQADLETLKRRCPEGFSSFALQIAKW